MAVRAASPSAGGLDGSRAQDVPLRKPTQQGQRFDRLIAFGALPAQGVCQRVEPLPVPPRDRNMMTDKDRNHVYMAGICREDESCPPRAVGNVR
jgi:hypothetical protein